MQPASRVRDKDNVCGMAYTKQLKAAGKGFNCDFMQMFAKPQIL